MEGQQPLTSPKVGISPWKLGNALSRRDFLKAGAATVAVVALGASCRPSVQPEPATFPFEALQFFNRYQAAIVHAAAGRIIPGTPQGPGAKEAGVVVFIDGALDGYDSTRQRDYIIGLDGMEAYARAKYGNGFAELTEQQQDDILTNMEQNSDEAKEYLPNPAGFFSILLTHVRQGMFSDPIYGGNKDKVGWKLIGHPGIVFGHDPSRQACDVEFPKEYMGSREYYEAHTS